MLIQMAISRTREYAADQTLFIIKPFTGQGLMQARTQVMLGRGAAGS